MDKPQTSTWVLYRRLAGYLKGQWGLFVLAVFSMIVVAITSVGFVYLMKPLVNEGFIAKDDKVMTWLPLAIVALFIVRAVFGYAKEYSSSYLSGYVIQVVRQELFAKLLLIPNRYYNQNSQGRMVSRITWDAAQIAEAGFRVITVLATDGVNVIGLLFWMLYLDWKLTLVTLFALLLTGGCANIVSKRLRGLSNRYYQFMGEMTQSLNELVDGIRVVKVYGGEAGETARFNTAGIGVRNNAVKQSVTGSISSGITLLLLAIALAVILYFAALQARNNQFSAGDFMSFLTAMIMMIDPIKRVTGVMQPLQNGMAAAQSVFDFLDEEEEPDNGTRILSDTPGGIEFSGIVHRYPEAERNSLNGVDLHVPAGKVYALVGASGCGKTTLVNMLPRFFDPSEGSIRIGGVDTREFTMASLREQMALVSQDVVLFNGTVASNIAYGLQANASEDDIIRAAKAANAWEFIEKLPQGLQTPIGENGMKLSGGQRQRIAIARALLKNAPILILDEATSALDNESERLVQAALEQLMRNRTTIVIAHRLSTVERADCIVVMHEGRIVEQGTHQELLAKNGRYAELSRFQAA